MYSFITTEIEINNLIEDWLKSGEHKNTVFKDINIPEYNDIVSFEIQNIGYDFKQINRIYNNNLFEYYNKKLNNILYNGLNKAYDLQIEGIFSTNDCCDLNLETKIMLYKNYYLCTKCGIVLEKNINY